MNIHDFTKVISSDRKINILLMFDFSAILSAYEAWNRLNDSGDKISYKNTYEIFKEFIKYGLIKDIDIRQPPHYAINYEFTERGKQVLQMMDKIITI